MKKGVPIHGKTRKSKLAPKKTLKQLKAILWRLFSKFIRKRDGYICYTCGRAGNDAGHYVPRGKSIALMFDERNVHCQCNTCNRWKRGNLSVYALNLERDYGMGILQEFERIRQSSEKLRAADLEAMIEYYQTKTPL